MRVAIGLLMAHGFPVAPEFFFSYEGMKDFLTNGSANALLPAAQRITEVRVLRETAFPIDVARNRVMAAFLTSGFDWLFFADCDHVFAPDTIARLLLHNKPVISGRYHMRSQPYHVVAYVKHRTKAGAHCYAPIHYGQGVFEIERGGAGCLLIHRTVAAAIAARHGHNWFRYQRGPEPPHDFSVSEDFWFYQCAREAGFSCWLDWEVEAKHLQLMPIDRSWNQAYIDAMQRDLAAMPPGAERQAMLDSLVACGFPEGVRLPSGDLVPPYSYTPGER